MKAIIFIFLLLCCGCHHRPDAHRPPLTTVSSADTISADTTALLQVISPSNVVFFDTTTMHPDFISKIFVDKKTDIVYRVYEKHTVEERNVTGAVLKERFDAGLVLPNGKHFAFEKPYEGVLSIDGGRVLTAIHSALKEKGQWFSELRSYTISGKGLRLVKTRRFDSPEVEFTVLKNGDILLCGQGEGGGVVFEQYTPALQLKQHYIPFKDGFTQAVYASTDSTIVIAANPFDTTSHSISIATLDMHTGKVITESETGRNDFRVVQIYPFEGGAVVFGFTDNPANNILLAAGYDGNIWWQKQPYNLPLHHKGIGVICSDKNLLCFNSDTVGRNMKFYISSVSKNTFAHLWSLCLNDIYSLPLLGSIYGRDRLRVSDWLIDKNYQLNFIVGQVFNSEDGKRGFYKGNILFIVDDSGRVVKKTNEIPAHQILKLQETSQYLNIITEKTIYQYEK